MKVSALVPWLTILACVFLGTAGPGYYYYSLREQPSDPEPDPTKRRPKPGHPQGKPNDNGNKGTPTGPPRKDDSGKSPQPGGNSDSKPPVPTAGVVVLVLQT